MSASLVAAVIVAGVVTSVPTVARADDTAGGGPSDAASATSEQAAAQIAEVYDHDVVVDSATTPTAMVTALPDGSMQLTEDSVPVRVQQDGAWTPVDTDLHTTDADWLSPRATDTHVRFSRGGSDALAQVQTDSGEWLTETWPDGGSLPQPTVSGSTATYEDVLPDVDLRLDATATGMTELLVVKTAEAAAEPSLQSVEMQMQGASVSTTAQEATASAADGSAVTSSNPTWWDASDDGDASGPGGRTEPAPLQHSSSGDTIALDVAQAAQHVDQYPLYVDPDWSAGQQSYWFDDAAYPNQSYLNGNQSAGYQSVGWANQDGITYMSRAFWQFDLSALAGKNITGAHFNAVATYSCTANNGSGPGMTVGAFLYGPVSAGQTWNQDQANQGAWPGSAMSNATIPGVSGCAMPAKTVGWDVTSGVTAKRGTTMQIGLRVDVENGWSRKHFNQGTTLTVDYNSVPGTPTGMAMTSPARTCGTTRTNGGAVNNSVSDVTFSVHNTDADGDNVHTVWQVMQADDQNTALATFDSGALAKVGTQTAVLKAHSLPATKDDLYMARAKTTDSVGYGGWSAWCYFTNKVSRPAVPTVTSTPTGLLVGGKGTVSLHTSADTRSVEYWVSVDASGSDTQAVATDAVTPKSAVPACSFRSGIVTYVCPSGGTATLAVGAPNDQFTVWFKAIDVAGNTSDPKNSASSAGPGNPSTVRLTADVDPQVSIDHAAHGWSTAADGSGDLQDDNASGPSLDVDPSVGADPTFDRKTVDALAFRDVLRVNRYNGSAGHRVSVAGGAPSGTTYESSLGELVNPDLESAPSGSEKILSCSDGSTNALVKQDSSATPKCPSGYSGPSDPMGYSFTSQSAAQKWIGDDAATPRQVFECFSGADYFASFSGTCEGRTRVTDLGWWPQAAATSTTGTVIDSTKSYTVSAWLRAPSADPSEDSGTAVSATSTTDSTPDNSVFYLQITSSGYRFCLRTQAGTLATDCAAIDTSNVQVSPSDWNFVTGVWDSTNHTVRIMVGASVTGMGTTDHDLGSGETDVKPRLVVGSAISNGGPSDAWNGSVADPTITQGIPDLDQLHQLMTVGHP